MTVWALSEAKSLGYDIDAQALAENVKWTKSRLLERIDLPRDTRPGWSMVNTPAMYLSIMALSIPKQDAVSADELKRIAGHLVRHQETDGSWSWASAPPKNRPPPVFESDEVATLMALMALERAPVDAAAKAGVQKARELATQWLAKATPNDTTQAAALRLLAKVQEAERTSIQSGIEKLLARQNSDGGWSQVKDAPSDAYATGQALYMLSLAGVERSRPEVQRGVAFLVATQKEDGSWPMIGRAHPGATPSNNLVPITYFGSAWATLGLLRSVAK